MTVLTQRNAIAFLNRDGDWLISSVKEQEWHFMFDKPQSAALVLIDLLAQKLPTKRVYKSLNQIATASRLIRPTAKLHRTNGITMLHIKPAQPIRFGISSCIGPRRE